MELKINVTLETKGFGYIHPEIAKRVFSCILGDNWEVMKCEFVPAKGSVGGLGTAEGSYITADVLAVSQTANDVPEELLRKAAYCLGQDSVNVEFTQTGNFTIVIR